MTLIYMIGSFLIFRGIPGGLSTALPKGLPGYLKWIPRWIPKLSMPPCLTRLHQHLQLTDQLSEISEIGADYNSQNPDPYSDYSFQNPDPYSDPPPAYTFE